VVDIGAINLEIDYKAKKLNLSRLQNGDFMQMLNFATLKKMDISLSGIKIQYVSILSFFFLIISEH